MQWFGGRNNRVLGGKTCREILGLAGTLRRRNRVLLLWSGLSRLLVLVVMATGLAAWGLLLLFLYRPTGICTSEHRFTSTTTRRRRDERRESETESQYRVIHIVIIGQSRVLVK
jgi:hypothetical protein